MKLAVGIPSFSGIQNASSLFRIRRPFDYIEFQGCPVLPQARSVVFSLFLESDCTHLLSLDGDMHFPPDAVEALIKADQRIVGLPCPKRIGNGFNVTFQPSTVQFKQLENGTVIMPVQGIGLAMMLIARDVLEQYRSDNPERAFYDDAGRKMYAFTDVGLHNGAFVCESYTWCRYMRERGEEIYCLPNWNVNHAGKIACFAKSIGLPHDNCEVCKNAER